MRDELLAKIRSDPESSFKRGASERQIVEAQKRLGVTFPPSYRQFLRHFNGGEFRFARMFRISAGGAGFFDLAQEMANLSQHFPTFRDRELLAFGDDYSGNHYCFDLTTAPRTGECAVMLWDRLMGEDRGAAPLARTFEAFLVKGLKVA